jgi:arylsulfatase A-like enzyme
VVCSTARRAGYATALFGKWHLGNLLAGRPGAAAEPFGHSDPGQHGFHDWLVTASVRPCGML